MDISLEQVKAMGLCEEYLTQELDEGWEGKAVVSLREFNDLKFKGKTNPPENTFWCLSNLLNEEQCKFFSIRILRSKKLDSELQKAVDDFEKGKQKNVKHKLDYRMKHDEFRLIDAVDKLDGTKKGLRIIARLCEVDYAKLNLEIIEELENA